MNPRVQELVRQYGLTPLPVEGTLFAATYRSAAETADGDPLGTAMIGLYAHEPLSRSLFHRLPADEVWHFYGGDAIRLVLLHPDGTSEDRWLGPEPWHTVQTVIPAGTWQAGELPIGGVWGLFGCTMAPGFTGVGFEGGVRSALLATHPDRVADIDRLAIPDGHAVAMPDGFAT